jgi:hypothetical protein
MYVRLCDFPVSLKNCHDILYFWLSTIQNTHILVVHDILHSIILKTDALVFHIPPNREF